MPRQNTTTKLSSYTIHDATEETDCDCCGYPLYVGDKALESVDGKVFCSEQCSRLIALQQIIP